MFLDLETQGCQLTFCQLLKSGLGAGIDIYDARGPNKTRLPVVGQLDVMNVQFADIDNESEEVLMSSTPRAAAYVGGGWDKSCLSATHPWVTDSAEVVSELSVSEVTITGRYVASKCLLSFSSDVRVQAHPDLRAAVDEALAIACLSRRTAALGDVFRRFGHFYVAAVELGGMKHATCTRNLTERVSDVGFLDWAHVDGCCVGDQGDTRSRDEGNSQQAVR